uniref:SWIM-type domain-containing protein n=1 Tax=Anopheles coluzzii TaxID=1518534 RepID=A0A6E8VXK1_ANOCL
MQANKRRGRRRKCVCVSCVFTKKKSIVRAFCLCVYTEENCECSHIDAHTHTERPKRHTHTRQTSSSRRQHHPTLKQALKSVFPQIAIIKQENARVCIVVCERMLRMRPCVCVCVCL